MTVVCDKVLACVVAFLSPLDRQLIGEWFWSSKSKEHLSDTIALIEVDPNRRESQIPC